VSEKHTGQSGSGLSFIKVDGFLLSADLAYAAPGKGCGAEVPQVNDLVCCVNLL